MLNSISRLGETGAEMKMETEFPVIPIFRNFRATSRGTPEVLE